MNKFTLLNGLVVPLDRANVDTDAIIPKQFLKSIQPFRFWPERVRRMALSGSRRAGYDNSRRPLNPDFVLNQPRYQGAQILLARENFGCGSSREHAPWALEIMAFASSSPPVLPTSFSTTVLRTVCCRSTVRRQGGCAVQGGGSRCRFQVAGRSGASGHHCA